MTPQKSRSGRQGLIRTPDKRQLKTWLEEDDFHRQIPWQDLPFFLHPNLAIYSYHSIITALRSIGYKRAIRPRRIKLTKANKQARVNFAREQLQLRPRPKDWENVDFSDETWATNDPMWKKWITIHDTEDPETWALLRRKPHGWMVWEQFAGRRKGPGFFWEKEYGGITAEKYIHHILPLVHQFLTENPEITVFQ